MNASMATSDRATHLKILLIVCVFSLVALGLAANQAGYPSRGIIAQLVATHGSIERARAPSPPVVAPVVAAISSSSNPM